MSVGGTLDILHTKEAF